MGVSGLPPDCCGGAGSLLRLLGLWWSKCRGVSKSVGYRNLVLKVHEDLDALGIRTRHLVPCVSVLEFLFSAKFVESSDTPIQVQCASDLASSKVVSGKTGLVNTTAI